MFSVLIFTLCLVTFSHSLDVWKNEITPEFDAINHRAAFVDWKRAFGKTYVSVEEEGKRFSIFMRNWRYVNKFNIADEQSVKLRLNQFADLTRIEFRYYINGHRDSCLIDEKYSIWYYDSKGLREHEEQEQASAPTAIDWTNYNGKSYVTPVKNQGQCGSCWAFAAVGCIESRGAIKNQQTGSAITQLSEQQLVDCSGSYGNNGCGGGMVDNAFKYVVDKGGLCTEKEYPYTARNGNCKASTCGTKYDPVSSYTDVKKDSTSSLETALATGPVAVGIEADESIFQFYSSGVMQPGCDAQIDHGVLVVGYGTDSGGTEYYKDYWKVKNSWGSSWGMNGYVLLCRNCNANQGKGECGLLQLPSYVTMQ